MKWWKGRQGVDSDDIVSGVAPLEDSGVRVLSPSDLVEAEMSPAARSELQRSFSGLAESSGATPPSTSRATVVIADDDRPDSVVLGDDSDVIDTGTASSTMDPRIRERRIAVRRSEGRRRIKWAVLSVSAVLVVVGVLVVLASPLLSVRTVEVDGAAYIVRFDGERLDEVVASLEGEPILTVDLGRAATELEESPWVRSARVTMRLPDRVRIEIRERSPLAWFTGADGLHRVIDDEGRVIVVLAGRPVDYVAIEGIGPDVGPGMSAGAPYRAAAQLVRALPDELRPEVASLGITDSGELTMGLVAGTEVRFGLPEDLQSKLVALVVVLRRQAAEDLDVIDLSSGEPTLR